MDHIIPLPAHYRYLNQFQKTNWAANPSLYRCVASSAAMLAEIACPGRWIPEELEHNLYVEFTGGPDNPSNQQGIDKAPLLAWFKKVGINYIDLEHLLGSVETLKHTMQRMNAMGIPQLLCVADESKLYDASGRKLHSWADQGLGHAFVRAGYSDSEGYGRYFEPAAPGFPQPVPIPWNRNGEGIEPSGLITCVAVLPHGMPVPPDNFDWITGTWPEPAKPKLDLASVIADVEAFKKQVDNERAASDATLMKILAELGAKS